LAKCLFVFYLNYIETRFDLFNFWLERANYILSRRWHRDASKQVSEDLKFGTASGLGVKVLAAFLGAGGIRMKRSNRN